MDNVKDPVRDSLLIDRGVSGYATRLLAGSVALTLYLLCFLLVLSSTPGAFADEVTAAAQANEPVSVMSVADFDKPFNKVSVVTAHNAFENNIQEQLGRGVRGFMLDLHLTKSGGPLQRPIRLCHAGKDEGCLHNDKKFIDVMNDIFIPFIKTHPNEVITIFLENYVSAEVLDAEFKQIPGLEDFAFTPRLFRERTEGWPTYREIIDSGRRILIFTDDNISAGEYDINGNKFTLMRDRSAQVQNTYDLGANPLNHQWACETRWEPSMSDPEPAVPCTVEEKPKGCPDNGIPCEVEREPLGCPKPAVPSKPVGGEPLKPSLMAEYLYSAPRLFVMNQFHAVVKSEADAGNIDNNLTYLERRVEKYCKDTAGVRMQPNFLVIDYNQVGDARAYASALTNGGYYFYEQNNANRDGDSTCVLPATQDYNISLASHGCENDEARSMELRGIKAGTRITLYDNSSGSTEDDYTIIDVKRDIGIDENVVVASFEKTEITGDYTIRHFHNNGLDGKVSRIKIEARPKEFSDAAIVLHEANNGGQNIVCTVDLTRPTAFDFGGACDNDEARSATIISAVEGTVITLFGDWGSSSCDQGCSTIEVKRNITWPKTINSFEGTYLDQDISVTRSGGSQQLDGKISSVKVAFKPDTTPPTAPRLPPAPDERTETTATISWEPSTDNIGVTGYRLSVNGATPFTVTETRRHVAGLKAGAPNTISVTAMDAAGNLSPASTMTFDALLPKPENVAFRYSSGIGYISWKLVDTDRIHEVWVNDIKVFEGTGVMTSFSSQRVPGPQYTIRVRAKKGTISSEFVELVQTVDDATPTHPGNPVVTNITKSSATYTWTPSSGDVRHYQVALNGLAVGTVTGTTYTSNSLREGLHYWVTVRAVGTNGNLSQPGLNLFRTLGTSPYPPPAVPKNLHVVSATPTTVTLAWSKVDNALVYGVSRRDLDSNLLVQTTQATYDTLATGLTYTFFVRGYDLLQQPSEPAEITVTVPDRDLKGPPVDLRIAQSGGGKVVFATIAWERPVTWTPSIYKITLTGPNGGVIARDVGVTKSVQLSLLPDTLYKVKIIGFNGSEESMPIEALLRTKE